MKTVTGALHLLRHLPAEEAAKKTGLSIGSVHGRRILLERYFAEKGNTRFNDDDYRRWIATQPEGGRACSAEQQHKIDSFVSRYYYQKILTKPTLVRQVKSFFQSIWMHIKNRKFFTEASVEEKRQKVCSTCTYLGQEGTWSGRCMKCGCVIKFKTMLKLEKCPISKW